MVGGGVIPAGPGGECHRGSGLCWSSGIAMRESQVRARVLDSIASDEVIAELHARGSDYAVVEMVVARGLSRAMIVGPLTLEQGAALRAAAKESGALAVLAKPAGRA